MDNREDGTILEDEYQFVDKKSQAELNNELDNEYLFVDKKDEKKEPKIEELDEEYLIENKNDHSVVIKKKDYLNNLEQREKKTFLQKEEERKNNRAKGPGLFGK
jgi:hypothetical protein